MKLKVKKRGQKLVKRWEKFSTRAKKNTSEHIQENLIERLPNARRVGLLILEWCLLVVVILSLSLTQAFWYSQSYSVQTFTDGGTYSEATLGRINSLNPLFAKTNSERALAKLMFATLSEVDYSGHTGLGLASQISPDETGTVWTVKLKENLKWSDGQPITLDDVVFTIGLLKNPAVNTSFASDFSGVKVEQRGDAVVFTLPTAYADFNSSLAVPILPKHILGDVPAGQLLENNFSTNPVTSGPFAFNAMQSVSAEGEKIVYLNANPNYYGNNPLLSSFVIHSYPTLDAIATAVATGEVTATAELPATYRDRLPEDTVYEKQTSLASGIFAFINTTNAPLNSVGVRQAVRKGIDMATVRSVLDYEYPLDYPILDSEIELKNYPAIPGYDLAAAKAELQAAGVVGQQIRLVTIDTGYFPALGDQLKTQLENLGFKVELAIYPPSQEFLVNVIQARNYSILLYEAELGENPDLYAYYHSSQISGINLSNYSSALVDDLILGSRTAMDPAVRVAKYETFLNRWVNDVPAIGIYQASLVYYFNKNVRNFSEDNRLVYATDRFMDVERWATKKIEKNKTP